MDVQITVTDSEALDVRLALNAHSAFWGNEARNARREHR